MNGDASIPVPMVEAPSRFDASNRFLDAYARIERRLRVIVNADRGVPFGQMVRDAARADRVVRRYRDDLLEFGELRNAIVHQRVDGRPIAEPHESTADKLASIADLLDQPPRLMPAFGRHVASAEPAEDLAAVLERMRDGDYSVIPVYDKRQYIGLLTHSAVARWLASVIGEKTVQRARVDDVLSAAKNPQGRVVFVRQNATVFDALDHFQRAAEKGSRLDALVITAKGDRDEAPIGIVTAADVPSLLEMIA